MFKTPNEIAEEYGIPRATVYYRIRKGIYRTDDYGKVFEEDVFALPPKKGRKPKKRSE